MNSIGVNDTEVFQFTWYICALPILATAIFLALGVLCFRKREIRRLSFIFFLLSLTFGGLLAPAMILDRIVVGPEELLADKGLWFSREPVGFHYSEVHFIKITTYQDTKGRSLPAWDIHYKAGLVRQIPLGDLWSSKAGRIMTLLRARGVHFTE